MSKTRVQSFTKSNTCTTASFKQMTRLNSADVGLSPTQPINGYIFQDKYLYDRLMHLGFTSH